MTGVDVRPAGTVVVSGVSSDAHTWNLVYLQLLIEELGFEVVNLGPCVPDELLVDTCARVRPVMVVVSSVNGHGHVDGLRLIRALRTRVELDGVVAVIGGKLGIDDGDAEQNAAKLVAAGYDAVFADGAGVGDFRALVRSLRPELRPELRPDLRRELRPDLRPELEESA
ncbi:cobalamin B12-binding domain-containing protein [Saccharothrix deserti]|uniref:cobalamin B12-binding domain-containing protein n=1 Tax=Saccharothrix deserti TaxID=2593674 RepID=UPI00131C0F96|nr:cobalamin-dependent protein [Saccharothrix deserti]